MCINRTKDMPKRSHEYVVANKQAGKLTALCELYNNKQKVLLSIYLPIVQYRCCNILHLFPISLWLSAFSGCSDSSNNNAGTKQIINFKF